MFVFKIGSDEVKVRTDAEFHALSDEEKISYVWDDLWPDDLGKTWIEKVLSDNDTGDLGLPEIWDEYVSEFYPKEYKEIEDEAPEVNYERRKLIFEFIDDLEDEDFTKALLFLVNKVYDRSLFYGWLIDSVKEQEEFTQTHTDSDKEYAADYYLKNKTISFGIYIENEELIKSKGLDYFKSQPYLERGIGEELIVTFPCSEEQEEEFEFGEQFLVKEKIVKEYDIDTSAITTEEGLRERGLPSLKTQKDKDEFLLWMKKRIEKQGFNLDNAPLYMRNAYESCDPNSLPPMIYCEWFKEKSI